MNKTTRDNCRLKGELSEHENASSTQNTTLNKTLLNILESLLADSNESQQTIDLQFRQSLDESNNSQLKSNTSGNEIEKNGRKVCL